MEDKMHLPFPLPGSPFASDDSEELADQMLGALEKLSAAKKKFKELLHPETIRETRNQLNELIFSYYGVGRLERILVEDVCEILEPSQRPGAKKAKGKALLAPKDSEVLAYSQTICESLNRFAAKFGESKKVVFEANLKPHSKIQSRLRLLVLKIRKPGRIIESAEETANSDRFKAALFRMEQALVRDDAPFQYLRGFKYLEGDDILILKPDVLRHWTRTSALNDAEEIIGHLMLSNSEKRK
jgi:hypothetical protein